MTVLFAFVASILIGGGAAMQQQAAGAEDAHAVMDPRLLFRLLQRKTWLAGMGISMVGFGLQATAIATGRLVLVEPIMAGNVFFALLVSARRAGRRLGPGEWRGAVLTLLGVSGFLVLASPTTGHDASPVVPWAVPIAILAVVVSGAVVGTRSWPPERKGIALGLAAGMAFGTADALLKVFTHVASDQGITGMFGHWGIYTWMVVSPSVFLLQQSAFHITHLGAAQPGAATLAPTTAALLGAAMFGEHLRGGWFVPGEALFAVVMLVGVVVLSSSPLVDLEALTAEEPATSP